VTQLATAVNRLPSGEQRLLLVGREGFGRGAAAGGVPGQDVGGGFGGGAGGQAGREQVGGGRRRGQYGKRLRPPYVSSERHRRALDRRDRLIGVDGDRGVDDGPAYETGTAQNQQAHAAGR
jgi:hypothetical protein